VALATPFLSVTYIRMMVARAIGNGGCVNRFRRLPCESKLGTTINVWLLSFPTVTCMGVESLGAFVPSPHSAPNGVCASG